MAELDALDPVPEQVTLESGFVIELERLKARQFFKLLRIVTGSGALSQLANAGLFSMEGQTEADFTAQFVTVVLMSIPEAEDETIDFIRAMARPSGLRTGRKLNKQDEDHNLRLFLEFDQELNNPELDDLISIIEAIVRREASDIQALGKRLAAMLKMAEKTGQIPTNEAPSQSQNRQGSTAASSEDSPVRSISSRRSTAGRTNSSTTSRSRASGSASRRSKSAASSNAGNETNG